MRNARVIRHEIKLNSFTIARSLCAPIVIVAAVVCIRPQFALADINAYDWLIGRWNCTVVSSFGNMPPQSCATVEFAKSGNEIRGALVRPNGIRSNLVRVVADNFGVTTWEVWLPGDMSCSGQADQWINAPMTDQTRNLITLWKPSRVMDGRTCPIAPVSLKFTLTR
jgi:hypothetical protein